MFGISRAQSSDVRDSWPLLHVWPPPGPFVCRTRDYESLPDVRAVNHWPLLVEIKSAEPDAIEVQQAVCARFHWLFARQILFRRRELR